MKMEAVSQLLSLHTSVKTKRRHIPAVRNLVIITTANSKLQISD